MADSRQHLTTLVSSLPKYNLLLRATAKQQKQHDHRRASHGVHISQTPCLQAQAAGTCVCIYRIRRAQPISSSGFPTHTRTGRRHVVCIVPTYFIFRVFHTHTRTGRRRVVCIAPTYFIFRVSHTHKDWKTACCLYCLTLSNVASALAHGESHMQKENSQSNRAHLVTLLLLFIADVQVLVCSLCLLLLQLLCVLKTLQCVSVPAYRQRDVRDAEAAAEEPKTRSIASQPAAHR